MPSTERKTRKPRRAASPTGLSDADANAAAAECVETFKDSMVDESRYY